MTPKYAGKGTMGDGPHRSKGLERKAGFQEDEKEKQAGRVTRDNKLEAQITSRPAASILPEQGLGRCEP